MENRRLACQLRWIERCLDRLDNPAIKGRSLSKEAKTKELENLIGKLAEARQNCQTESDIEWITSISQSLKNRVYETLNPQIVGDGDSLSPATFL